MVDNRSFSFLAAHSPVKEMRKQINDFLMQILVKEFTVQNPTVFLQTWNHRQISKQQHKLSACRLDMNPTVFVGFVFFVHGSHFYVSVFSFYKWSCEDATGTDLFIVKVTILDWNVSPHHQSSTIPIRRTLLPRLLMVHHLMELCWNLALKRGRGSPVPAHGEGLLVIRTLDGSHHPILW